MTPFVRLILRYDLKLALIDLRLIDAAIIRNIFKISSYFKIEIFDNSIVNKLVIEAHFSKSRMSSGYSGGVCE